MDKIKKITEELFSFLQIEASVEVEKDEQETCRVRIETPETAILIGKYGETLDSLQLILNLILAKKLGSWQKVIVNIGDYREKRQAYLEDLALSTAKRVAQTKEEEILPNMSSFERRIIHLTLNDNNEVKTESTGDSRDRRVVIKPK